MREDLVQRDESLPAHHDYTCELQVYDGTYSFKYFEGLDRSKARNLNVTATLTLVL